LLKVKNPNGPGLRPNSGKRPVQIGSPGHVSAVNSTLSPLTSFLEEAYCKVPIIDRTGLSGHFDYELKWNPDADRRRHNLEALNEALNDQLGLELVPGREPVALLVVEKASD